MAIPSVYRLAAEALKIMRANAPVDTGNLRDHGIWMHKTGKNEYTVFIGAPTAPYAVYTNEVWVAPFWRNKKTGEMRRNPNEHWIDKGVEEVVDEICRRTGGTLASIEGIDDRWINKSYWDSDDGKERLARYGISDYKSAVS